LQTFPDIGGYFFHHAKTFMTFFTLSERVAHRMELSLIFWRTIPSAIPLAGNFDVYICHMDFFPMDLS
jgi:hypothetical protein